VSGSVAPPGRGVQRLEVIVVSVEEVQDLVVRLAGKEQRTVATGGGEGGGLFDGVAVTVVKSDQGTRHFGVVACGSGDLFIDRE
jgi:hypothetical protein